MARRESEDGEIEKKRVGDSETLTEKLSNVVSFSFCLFVFFRRGFGYYGPYDMDYIWP